jgi:glycosyltransferase involved in cell wall biosynthesis
MQMNILFFDHHTELGGAEFYLYETATRLDENVFNVIVCVGAEGIFEKKLQRAGIAVINLKLPSYFRALPKDPKRKIAFISLVKSICILPLLIKRTVSLFKKNKTDFAIVNTIKSALFVIPAAFVTKVKTIIILHDYLTESFFKYFFIKVIIFFLKRSEKVICVSGDIKRTLDAICGNTINSEVIFNGVDIDRFNPDIAVEDLKKGLAVGQKHVVSCVGRLEPWKGQKLFIQAAHTICLKRDDVLFLVVGGAFFQRKDYEAECRLLVKDLGLKDKVLFLGFRDDIEKIIVLSDIVVHSSILPEPFGRVLIESMSCAKPVISINTGGSKEVITPETGIILETADPDDLAHEIIKYLDNPVARTTIAHAARKRAVEIFDSKKIAKQWERVFTD